MAGIEVGRIAPGTQPSVEALLASQSAEATPIPPVRHKGNESGKPLSLGLRDSRGVEAERSSQRRGTAPVAAGSLELEGVK